MRAKIYCIFASFDTERTQSESLAIFPDPNITWFASKIYDLLYWWAKQWQLLPTLEHALILCSTFGRNTINQIQLENVYLLLN